MRSLAAAMVAAILGVAPLAGCGVEMTVCHDLEVAIAPDTVAAGDAVEVTVDTVVAECAARAAEPSYADGEALWLFVVPRGSEVIAGDVAVPLDAHGAGTATLRTDPDMEPGVYSLIEGGFLEDATVRGELAVTAP